MTVALTSVDAYLHFALCGIKQAVNLVAALAGVSSVLGNILYFTTPLLRTRLALESGAAHVRAKFPFLGRCNGCV